MASFTKFNNFAEAMVEGMNLGSDTFKVYLSNTAPTATNTQFGSPPEISAANGYVACGITVTIAASSQSSGTYKLDPTGCTPIFKASGGTVGPFRYVILYDSTVSGFLVGAWDYGSSISLNDTETLTVNLSAANGILQVS